MHTIKCIHAQAASSGTEEREKQTGRTDIERKPRERQIETGRDTAEGDRKGEFAVLPQSLVPRHFFAQYSMSTLAKQHQHLGCIDTSSGA